MTIIEGFTMSTTLTLWRTMVASWLFVKATIFTDQELKETKRQERKVYLFHLAFASMLVYLIFSSVSSLSTYQANLSESADATSDLEQSVDRLTRELDLKKAALDEMLVLYDDLLATNQELVDKLDSVSCKTPSSTAPRAVYREKPNRQNDADVDGTGVTLAERLAAFQAMKELMEE